ncbi:hypothetical protein HZR84_01005 [Hyphobacterium sp. CCMP332]|nr:hypothetical protein HZR84_01005 [Hyphobacterium sp. CCMP332]
MKAKIILIISIDTECDKGPAWKIKKPMSFDNIIHGIPKYLNPLFEKYNIRPSYLLSPEVMQNAQCVDLFKSLTNAELGTHLHGEFIEPQADWEAGRTKTPQLAYDSNVEKEKLKNLTNLFESKFNYAPKSFRAGRWGISKNTLPFLEELGYTVDSSVCSFRTHTFKQGKVNFWGAPLQPYHPSTQDFRKKGKMKILEVPATLGNPHLMKWPRPILRKLDDNSKWHKKILGKLGKSSKITWFRPWKSNAKEMINLADSFVKNYSNSVHSTVLNMMFHSNEILAGTSPYAQTEIEVKSYFESLDTLFDYLYGHFEMSSLGLSDVQS